MDGVCTDGVEETGDANGVGGAPSGSGGVSASAGGNQPGVDVYLEYGHNFDQYIHDTLLDVGGGRPIAFTENGEMPNIPAISGNQPNWVYWATWWGFEGADSGNADALYSAN